MLANDIQVDGRSGAEAFITTVDRQLAEIDSGEVWDYRVWLKLRRVEERARALGLLMETLLTGPCRLKRVRVWRSLPDGYWIGGRRRPKLYCIGSLTTHDATLAGAPQRDAYVNAVGFGDDPYCRYLVHRSSHDQMAKRQRPAMFGTQDSNWRMLHKDPDGSWIVAPLVYKGNLVGALAADSHCYQGSSNPKALVLSEDEEAFQVCAVDVVADILRFLVPLWPLPEREDLRMFPNVPLQ